MIIKGLNIVDYRRQYYLNVIKPKRKELREVSVVNEKERQFQHWYYLNFTKPKRQAKIQERIANGGLGYRCRKKKNVL